MDHNTYKSMGGVFCVVRRHQLFGILSAILQFDTLYMYNAFD